MPCRRALLLSATLLLGCESPPSPASPAPYGAAPGAAPYGTPAYGAPAYGAPAYGAPAYGAPGYPPLPPPPSPAVPPSPAAAAACASLADCTGCASQPACRWCTEPRACTAAGSPCAGLMLGHPGTCDNDPVERARLLTQREETRTRGLTAEGPPVVGRLESFPGVDFTVARGRCYAAIVRFGPGARLGDVTRDDRMVTREESAGGGSIAQPSTPGMPPGLYCPRSPGKLSVWYEDRWTRGRVTAAGKGEISVQLYSAPIAEADLRAGDARSAAIDRRIQRMPAGCDDCDYNCRASGTACERRCFVDTAGRGGWNRNNCEYGCQQITRACQDSCEAQCR